MSVEFDDEQNFSFKSREVLGDYKKPGFVDWLQKKGIVKDDRTAQYFMFGVIIVCLSLSLIIIFRDSIFPSQDVEPLSKYEIEQLPPVLREAYLKNVAE